MSNTDPVSLEDKYHLDSERALIAGRQALVRLPILQRELDRSRGLRTAGLISGYRGSPLGGYDMELWKAQQTLRAHDVQFQPGLNEDLALTSLIGAQQLDFVPGARVDGVFCIWYGKGPGVDRSGDAIKHGNLQGTSARGGVLLVFGDDHNAKSSTTAHQSDLTLASWEVPILYPASVADILQLGLAGIALSRFSGLLVGLKLVNETADASSVVTMETGRAFRLPEIPDVPGGVNIRPEGLAMQQQDMRLVRYKLPRAAAFARENRLDRIVFGSSAPQFLIATAGKALADVHAALEQLDIDESTARSVGIGVYKIALLFPLEPSALVESAKEAEEILFVEEKRPHAETQAKGIFYNLTRRPRVSGKATPEGEPLLPSDASLDARIVALALAKRLEAALPNFGRSERLKAAVARICATTAEPMLGRPLPGRRPAFCPGCPHNISTKVPVGSFGATGIGCHGMVLFQRDRNPLPMGQMGAEGAHWIGLAPFTETPHVFQNLGDGTYNHSGSLAIRAAVQAGVNITYKILFNDAVAMTGGQPVEGHLTVRRVAEQVRAEGVSKVVVVSERPERFEGREALSTEVEVFDRDALPQVQETLRKTLGVSVLIYDQTCAAEKRRRRRLKSYPDPDRRLFINSAVCEGCGDCSKESNCVAIQPLETELGRKRRIDQSACNKDFSCVKGFCPSFVTVEGGRLRRAHEEEWRPANIPEPEPRALGRGFDLVIAGIGGTGVVTVSAILGMAARIENLQVSLYDSTGLSQKGGQVFSHVRIRAGANSLVPARVGPEEADLILACDLVAAVQPEALETIAPGRTVVIGNRAIAATAAFQEQRDFDLPSRVLQERLQQAAESDPMLVDATELATTLLGDSIGANLILLGYAWQRGAIPLRRHSIERAIELNGKAVTANLKAFEAGRAAACQRSLPNSSAPPTVEEFIRDRVDDLTRYWNAGYASRYADLMWQVRSAAETVSGGAELVWAVAKSAYHLMAYKDEYEVARLYTDGRFRAALEREFDRFGTVRIHLAPPVLARKLDSRGRPRKRSFGPWIFSVLRIVSAMRVLREGPLDLFARSPDRRIERRLRDGYESAIRQGLKTLSAATVEELCALARMPLEVRGFGPVKTEAAKRLLEVLTRRSAT